MIRVVIVALAMCAMFALSASAQLPMMGYGPGNFAGSGGGGSACAAGQLDFSDPTGCNLTLYMVGL